MNRLRLKPWCLALALLPALPSAEQSQSCPLNINFSTGTLLHWEAYTGNNKDGNGPGAIMMVYDSSRPSPDGTIGISSLPEYNLPGVSGIRVITNPTADPFGGFATVPTINGYAYHYSILLGSTSISQRQPADPNDPMAPPSSGSQGGYVRGISYLINVPPGPPSVPYTMTYAYAMVLENGTHTSINQPMARAIISTPGGVIDCASPEYFLPTLGGNLDSATARTNGFTPSPVPTPNESRNPQFPGQHLQDVWTKGWTEVTFDLSPYRGQQVTLTFEADNCVPGGHFAYAYFALRDICAGLQISGDSLQCTNSIARFSIPSLHNAEYEWFVPDGWIVQSGMNDNTLYVKVGGQPGWVVARERNSCTTLTDSLYVDLYKGALPVAQIDPRDTTICYGQAAPLTALITTGTDFNWTSRSTFRGGNKGTIAALPFTTGVVAAPEQSTDYILNIRNQGCPIVVSDTFTVNVVPPIHVNPGNDTLVVVNQPMHFHATSSDPYKDDFQWSPATNLSDPNSADPVAQFGPEYDNLSFQVTASDSFGCFGTATVKITVAHTLPDIFVPTAFTPGLPTNSLFRPVCMGIASLDYFRVYNRWGQLVFSTSQMGHGWDGRIQGRMQESNAYLWITRGVDYTGRVITKQGTVVLVR
jgi:hypothetical protein